MLGFNFVSVSLFFMVLEGFCLSQVTTGNERGSSQIICGGKAKGIGKLESSCSVVARLNRALAGAPAIGRISYLLLFVCGYCNLVDFYQANTRSSVLSRYKLLRCYYSRFYRRNLRTSGRKTSTTSKAIRSGGIVAGRSSPWRCSESNFLAQSASFGTAPNSNEKCHDADNADYAKRGEESLTLLTADCADFRF